MLGGEEGGELRTFRTGLGLQLELLEGHWRFRNKGKFGEDTEGALPTQELLAKVRQGRWQRRSRETGGRKLAVGGGGKCLSDLLTLWLEESS